MSGHRPDCPTPCGMQGASEVNPSSLVDFDNKGNKCYDNMDTSFCLTRKFAINVRHGSTRARAKCTARNDLGLILLQNPNKLTHAGAAPSATAALDRQALAPLELLHPNDADPASKPRPGADLWQPGTPNSPRHPVACTSSSA